MHIFTVYYELRVCVISEDTYGHEFFKELFKRLKDTYSINNLIFHNSGRSYTTYRGCHYDKLYNIAKILCSASACDVIIITKDADGRDIADVKNEVRQYIPRDCTIIKILVFNYEIEDWIIYSKLGHLDPNPSKYLKDHLRYEKFQLPKYVKELDFNKLCNLESFRDFIKYLNTENLICK